ncbi:MAG: hypothetical protein U1F65_01575 [Verrucomicrobiota bacterium]
MSLPDKILLLLVAGLGLQPSLSSRAEDAAPAPFAVLQTNEPPGFKAVVQPGEIIGDRQVHHAVLNYGTNEFSFVVPDSFHVDNPGRDRLSVVSQEYDCFITLRLVEAPEGGVRDPNVDECRSMLLSRFPRAVISEEYSRTVANHPGPAFDFEWKDPDSAVQAGRMVFIRTSAGILEFTMTTAKDKFGRGEHVFNSVLLTFRTNENGKLQIVRLEEKA